MHLMLLIMAFICFWSGLSCPAVFGNRRELIPPEVRPVVNREYLRVILEMIDKADESIEFIQLEFHYDPTVKKIQEALKKAVLRGVKVRGILENEINFNPKSSKFLKQLGIDSMLDTDKKATHNKLFIVDGDEILIGSTNLSGNSIDKNNETNLYVKNRQVGNYFQTYFNKLRLDSYTEPEMETLKLPGIQAVVNRRHFDAILDLLTTANKKIWVLLYGMKYYNGQSSEDSKTNRLIEALLAAKRRGVDVRVILDRSDYNKRLNQINATAREFLEKGGVEVRFDSDKITTHAKMIIADEKVMIGSANWGYLAMEIRNEASLIISLSGVVSFFEDYFMMLWAGENYPVDKGKKR